MSILNRKKDYDYFEQMYLCSKFASESAEYLHNALTNFDASKIEQHVEAMHQIEHNADLKKHEITKRLAQEFMTPIEREDIASLLQALDNIVDLIEDVIRRIYMFNIVELRSEALDFSSLILQCTNAFVHVMDEFRNFRRSKTLFDNIIEVNNLESAGDKLHTDSVRRLFTENNPATDLVVWRSMFETLESCLDACEDASDLVENVVMKNT